MDDQKSHATTHGPDCPCHTTDRDTLREQIETAMTDDGHRMPRTDETRYLAHVAAGVALAVLPPPPTVTTVQRIIYSTLVGIPGRSDAAVANDARIAAEAVVAALGGEQGEARRAWCTTCQSRFPHVRVYVAEGVLCDDAWHTPAPVDTAAVQAQADVEWRLEHSSDWAHPDRIERDGGAR